MRFQDALENARIVIAALILGLVLLFACNVGLLWLNFTTQQSVKVYIPPRIPESGLTQTANTVPDSTVFSFAFWAWQSINDWPNNGMTDYKNKINTFSPYVTERFKQYLLSDYENRLTNDEVQDRIRSMTGMNNGAYSPKDVEYVGHGTWLVHFDMRLTERMNVNGKIVKDVEISYVLRVVKHNISASSNHYGLAIDGFAVAPKRIKTFI